MIRGIVAGLIGLALLLGREASAQIGPTGNTEYVMDAGLTIATSRGGMEMCRSSAAAPTAVTADDEAVLPWCLRNGARTFVLTAAGALIGGDATNGIDVDVTRMPADATELPAAAALADNTSNPTVPGVAAFLMCYDGSTWDRCPPDTAHGVTDAGSPLKIGFVATSSIVARTPVTTGQRTDALAGMDGVVIVRPHSNLEDRVSGRTANTDGAATSVVAAQGAGVRFCATTLVVSNSSATNVTVDLTDGSGGTALITLPAAANMGGGVVPLQTPLCTTANTALFMDGSAAATTVTVTAVGFKTEL